MKRTELKRGTSQMKRSPIKKVGKQGKRNASANKEIAELFAMNFINYCEADFPHECSPFLTIAHRHKRAWYYSQPELLSDFNQVAKLCVQSHDMIEHDAEATEELFIRLRGE